MSKAIRFRNGMYLDSSSVWFSRFKGNLKQYLEFHALQPIPNISTCYWRRLGQVVFYNHNQGLFCQLRIFIGAGQNGNNNQNAYIDLTLQMGWSGSVGGRAGCSMLLYPFNTVFTTTNTVIRVFAENAYTYNIYFKQSDATYCRPNIIMLAGATYCKFVPDTTVIKVGHDCDWVGTECNLCSYSIAHKDRFL